MSGDTGKPSGLVHDVAVFFQQKHGIVAGFLLVDFNAQHALLERAVVDDANIFDADAVVCQNGGNGCDSPRLIDDVTVMGPAEVPGMESR